VSTIFVVATFNIRDYVNVIYYLFFFYILRPPPGSTLFPYTTLFRSRGSGFGSCRSKFGRSRRGTTVTVVGWTWPRFSSSGCFLRSEEHTSELQSRFDLVCRLLLEKKNTINTATIRILHPLFAHDHYT